MRVKTGFFLPVRFSILDLKSLVDYTFGQLEKDLASGRLAVQDAKPPPPARGLIQEIAMNILLHPAATINPHLVRRIESETGLSAVAINGKVMLLDPQPTSPEHHGNGCYQKRPVRHHQYNGSIPPEVA